ncbi:hypothetical protein NGG61_13660 [Enterococcus casseliflavus]|uniref:hypothetical protein n=1 Tax=Enterococcus casseliflavus TaxID=37734 RepID=UPI002DBBD8F6|nr:hypothetical protein [Enterococcus casseliflavus]MEB8400969.1 hypothetical protein [Enterococcus casseliflavus]
MSKKQELKNYVINSIVQNALEPNELLRLINLLPDQPQLNENQQIVLDWLKNIYNSPIIINPIAVVFSLHNELVKDSEIDAVEAYEELGFDEEIQVLQVFSQWAQEQEEE